jgi:hypothetical protein
VVEQDADHEKDGKPDEESPPLRLQCEQSGEALADGRRWPGGPGKTRVAESRRAPGSGELLSVGHWEDFGFAASPWYTTTAFERVSCRALDARARKPSEARRDRRVVGAAGRLGSAPQQA